MALSSNFLLHLTFAITFGARTVFMNGRAISWIGNVIYIKWKGERNKRVKENCILKNDNKPLI